MNAADLLRNSAASHPDHAALVFESRTFSYRELDHLTDCFAASLRVSGVKPGDVVGVLLESGPELVIAVLGAFKAGVVPNVVNAMLRSEEVRAVVADSGAVWLLTDAERSIGLEPVRDGLAVRRTVRQPKSLWKAVGFARATSSEWTSMATSRSWTAPKI